MLTLGEEGNECALFQKNPKCMCIDGRVSTTRADRRGVRRPSHVQEAIEVVRCGCGCYWRICGWGSHPLPLPLLPTWLPLPHPLPFPFPSTIPLRVIGALPLRVVGALPLRVAVNSPCASTPRHTASHVSSIGCEHAQEGGRMHNPVKSRVFPRGSAWRCSQCLRAIVLKTCRPSQPTIQIVHHELLKGTSAGRVGNGWF